MRKTPLFAVIISILMYTGALAQVNRPAAEALIKRVVPTIAGHFIVEEIPAENGRDVFELSSRNGKIVLGGNKGLSVASALGYYLKRYCRCDYSWNGGNMHLPAALPVVAKKVHRQTPYQYRYYLNYCTFNYSASWWNWERWQHEIDWMALEGINMPLALTGEEAIWQKVYRNMGFTDAELKDFFSGPAYFAWFWMGNLDGWGGPLPQHWIDTHRELQKKILERERSFGMMPVLPAFSGHVPPSFKEKFPQVKLNKTNWGQGFGDVYLLDANDPMFVELGKKYIEAQTAEYGTDHLYSSDTFNENTPPTSDSTFLSGVSKNIYRSMTAADPKAVWVMQGWLFYNAADFWKPTQTKAVLNAVPNDHMVILDLYTDEHPMWVKNEAYYGKPWIWNMLQNFGGNLSIHGPMERVAIDPNHSLHTSKNMVGIGLTPEAIEQNPAIFELMMDNVWRDSPIRVSATDKVVSENYTLNNEPWLVDYAQRRYGKNMPQINQAWNLLLKSTYKSSEPRSRGVASIIVARPGLDISDDWRVDTVTQYKAADLAKAWQLFINNADALKASGGFQYDIVNVTRQVLAIYANRLNVKMIKAYKTGNSKDFKQYSTQFLQLMDDIDALLATRKDFLLGKWIHEARENGVTPPEKDLYEFNARDLITLWGGRDNPLHEYSNRQWSGLIKGFYKPRWQMFITLLDQSLADKKPVDMPAFTNKIQDWEWNWVHQHEPYPYQPKGDAIQVSKSMFAKYSKLVNATF